MTETDTDFVFDEYDLGSKDDITPSPIQRTASSVGEEEMKQKVAQFQKKYAAAQKARPKIKMMTAKDMSNLKKRKSTSSHSSKSSSGGSFKGSAGSSCAPAAKRQKTEYKATSAPGSFKQVSGQKQVTGQKLTGQKQVTGPRKFTHGSDVFDYVFNAPNSVMTSKNKEFKM